MTADPHQEPGVERRLQQDRMKILWLTSVARDYDNLGLSDDARRVRDLIAAREIAAARYAASVRPIDIPGFPG